MHMAAYCIYAEGGAASPAALNPIPLPRASLLRPKIPLKRHRYMCMYMCELRLYQSFCDAALEKRLQTALQVLQVLGSG